MKTNFKFITSREYKLILNVDRFYNRQQGVLVFWDMVKYLLNNINPRLNFIDQNTKTPTFERRTWYLDTPKHFMNQNGFSLRMRSERNKNKSEYKITLKYRSPDRFISAAQNLNYTGVKRKHSKNKFEEDIVPAFQSKFANSTSIELKKQDVPPIKNIKDVRKLFPGIKVLELPDQMKIGTVNNFVAHEKVYHIGRFSIDDIDVKCCLSFWYLLSKDNSFPLVAEFSFDYDQEEKMGFPLLVTEICKDFYTALQKQSGWMNVAGTTKTFYAYNGF